MVGILTGLGGGLVGSIAMTLAARAIEEEPWPAAVVWAMYLGDGDPANYLLQGQVAHLAYGALAGGLFASLAGVFPTPVGALGWAVGWALLLAAVALGGWLRVLIGAEIDAEAAGRVVALHVLYGLVLGGVVVVASA